MKMEMSPKRPRRLLTRVARYIAQADENYGANAEAAEKEFFAMMDDLKFMPNSPTLMNAGRPLGQLSACFVLPIEDSMEGIFSTLKNAALIHKSGGGTGFSFSRIRAAGTMVGSTGGVASGPVSFMKVYNAATEAVKQGGTRRGANMGILRVDHPDIMEFISCKEDLTQVTNFNISVGITEKFMEAVKANEEYDLIEPQTGNVLGQLNAAEVFDKIVKNAHTSGEPGIVFLDRINRDNPCPTMGEMESTNPCGEQPLMPYESCNLGSINLSRFVTQGEKPDVDFEVLGETVDTAVHFLDNVIDMNNYPLKEIDETTKSSRKIGLGVMGFADLLMMLGVGYNTKEGVKKGAEIMEFIENRARKASQELAKIRGPYPLFAESIYKDGPEQRNSTVTTIAPTGTISIIAGASSGIEPVFAFSFIRNVMDNDHLLEVHPYFEKVAKEKGWYSAELMEQIAEQGTLQHLDGVPEEDKRVFICAHDVSPFYHVAMQAAFQKYTDNAVSKTVNFPKSATVEEVREVYELAYESGCKGVTIYRDGSRDAQVLNIGKVNDGKEKDSGESLKTVISPRPRPEVTQGITQKVKIGCGNLYITVNYDENGICEVFTNLGRAGGCPSQSEATSRLASMALRSGVEVENVIEQLRGIRCHSTLRKKDEDIKVLSCPDAIGRVLEKVLEVQKETFPEDSHNRHRDIVRGESVTQISKKISVKKSVCPECASEMEQEGGCSVCRSCGYSKCG